MTEYKKRYIIIVVFNNVKNRYVSRTRVSAVEVWRNDSNDGEVQIVHGVNSWPALLEQLKDNKKS
ncbi:unnamed protein product [Onchocerca flexuosa]|uniref:PC4 domain-containing protein n=1 Tax=Onchocerca flexuosa TaxID=387005 RepID=A0A183HS57_9BILA|nr:unnamed protein product [Onchocerca flexuosa]